MSALMLGTLAFTSCHENPYIQNPGNNEHDIPGEPLIDWSDDDSTLHIELQRLRTAYPDKRILSVEEAIAICQTHNGWDKSTVGSNVVYTDKEYSYVYGVVTGTYSSKASSEAGVYFYISSSVHSIATKRFLAYELVWAGGGNFPHGYQRDVALGRWVILDVRLCQFGSTPETANKGKVCFTSYTTPVIPTEGQGTKESPYTIADAIRLATEGMGVRENEWIHGYLVGANMNDSLETQFPFHDNTTIVLADQQTETAIHNTVTVDLWSGLKYKSAREAISPFYNEGQNLGKEVLVCGAIGMQPNPQAILHVASPDTIQIGQNIWKK